MTEWLYSDVVKDHFMNPKNVLEDDESSWPCDGRASLKYKMRRPVLILLRIKDDVITDVRWKTYGCASAIASTSILSEAIKECLSKPVHKPQDIVAKLGVLPASKITVPFSATRRCVRR